jgi:putative endonuclease
MPRTFCVYILTNRRRTLYIGITANIHRRMQQHLAGKGSAFVGKYRLHKLVYVETSAMVVDAIAREKELKGWVRSRKIALIEAMNPGWTDLAEEWGWRSSVVPLPSGPSLRSG